MARCVALEYHHAAGVRPDIDDCHNVAVGVTASFRHARHYLSRWGIALHLLSELQELRFMQAFTNKGCFKELMGRIPIRPICAVTRTCSNDG